MTPAEKQYHVKIVDELLDNMNHSSAQVNQMAPVWGCLWVDIPFISLVFWEYNAFTAEEHFIEASNFFL